MNVLECILEDWQACRPEESYSQCGHLPYTHQTRADIVEVVVSRIHSQALSYVAAQDVHMFLAQPNPLDYSPFERILLRSGRRLSLTGCETDEQSSQRIYFLRFWQATQEVWRRIYQVDDTDDAPLVDELAPFRDAVLRRYDACTEGEVADDSPTLAWMIEEMSSARSSSADPDAWQSLAHVLAHDQPSGVCLTLDEVSVFIFSWLLELVSDYRHGPRGALVQAVIDVAKCNYRDACWHLGASAWDVETALISVYASRGDSASFGQGAMRSWSSGGAKLRQTEIECPICTTAYGAQCKSVSTRCCFQTICDRCRTKMNGVEGFQCPFCRGFEKNSKQERRRQLLKAGGNHLLGRVDNFFQAARGIAGSAQLVLGELAEVLRETADHIQSDTNEQAFVSDSSSPERHMEQLQPEPEVVHVHVGAPQFRGNG